MKSGSLIITENIEIVSKFTEAWQEQEKLNCDILYVVLVAAPLYTLTFSH